MVFSWLKHRRRKRILSEPFPDAWREILEHNVCHYGYLDSDEQQRIRELVHVFVVEKNWEGCGGLQMTDEIKVTIAGEACQLLLGLDGDEFDHVLSILVYPTGYRVPQSHPNEYGLIDERGEGRLGESWHRGPVILSWADAQRGSAGRHDGENLVLHEFAHQLDMLSRDVDGVPLLENTDQYRRWHEVMTAEYEALVDASRHRRATLLDIYGATNPAEFFAVATECFFERPGEMERQHSAMYQLLKDYYRQDPAERVRRHATTGRTSCTKRHR